MTNQEKSVQLKKFKALATGLFVAMLMVFIIATYLEHHYHFVWVGYVRAFAEAAMVGALADWFAVTALFHHPLGLKIPHTNLIEKSKERIGDNLGGFVVDNFLNAENIRPYVKKIQLAEIAGSWLLRSNNRAMLIKEISYLINDVLHKMKDEEVTNFISAQLRSAIQKLDMPVLLANGIDYLMKSGEQDRIIAFVAAKVKSFIGENAQLIEDRVAGESYFFVPKFVEKKIAAKVVAGLYKYFDEVEQNPDHPLKSQLETELLRFAEGLKTNDKLRAKLNKILQDFLAPEDMQRYSANIWQSIKQSLTEALQKEDGGMKKYLDKSINDFAQKLKTDDVMQQKIDGWIQHNAYRYILRIAPQAGELISNTVGNWQGRELSNKLELEVGKDLQFIRINGTLVGGLVGLLIYTITRFFTS